jgi:hypothetical protein
MPLSSRNGFRGRAISGWFTRRVRFWKRLATEQQEEENRASTAVSRSEEPRAHRYLPFDKVALKAYRLGFWAAPSWLFVDARKRYVDDLGNAIEGEGLAERQERNTALYVLAWFFILTVAWYISPQGHTFAVFLGALALWRLFEIGITVLGFVLDQREPKIAQSLITIAILALQVALIFAILDHSFAKSDFLKPSALTTVTPVVIAKFHHVLVTADLPKPAPAEKPLELLYITVTYMTTVGNQYTPSSWIAHLLEIGANISGLLLLGIVAARAIGLVGETKTIAAGLETQVAGLEGHGEALEKRVAAMERAGGGGGKAGG